ncbi:MAG: hypothetical protein IJM25_04215 [Eubacterium sp.]|nr:hypothetical protein [Eubacterium sp.]
MTINLDNKITDAACREALDIASQYGRLVRNHNAKISDGFKSRLIYVCVSLAVLTAMVIASVIFWGFSTLTIIAIAILAFDAILGFGIQIRMKKAVEQMKADKRKREIELDEEGIEVKKDGKSVMRQEWKDIAALRVFNENFCLIAKEYKMSVVIVNKLYADQVKQFLQTQKIDHIEMIG